MALVFGDRVLETSTTTGTGAFTLAGAVTGYQRFSAVCSTSDTIHYGIFAVDGNGNPSGDWETGLGTYSGTNTLTRTTVQESSNAGSAVNFSAGTKWVIASPTAAIFSALPSEASASEILVGSETEKFVSPDKFRTATAPATLTDAATIAVDFEAGRNFTVTLGGNRTLGNPTNVQAGDSGTIYVIQDGTGSRTLAFGSNWKHVGSAPTISTTASAVDVFSYFARSTTAITLSYLGTEV